MYPDENSESDGFEVHVAMANGAPTVSTRERIPDQISSSYDMQMPGMNGDEALAEIRKHDWGEDESPSLLLTNLGEEEAPKHLHGLGIETISSG